MSEAYARKKQPEAVRRGLLDAAARLAVEEGLNAVTVQAVAIAAGVTKGGLFHHFPSKQALIEGVFADLLDQLDAEIDAHMAADETTYGAFTRAYVESFFTDEQKGEQSPWSALCVSIVADPALRRLWAEWLRGRIRRHHETDSDPTLEIVRLAADGAWLAFILRAEKDAIADTHALRARLIAMTAPVPDRQVTQ